MKKTAAIYVCSHRKGNSNTAAGLIQEEITKAGGTATIITLHTHTVLHCLACGYCDSNTTGRLDNRCILSSKDDSVALFTPLFQASMVFFVSPIYFYHFPSLCKTWIDRAQQFWKARKEKEPWVANLPKRSAYSVFIAGRPTGKRLFEGAQLSLDYFLWNFNLTHTDSLCLRGLDAPTALASSSTDSVAVQRMARKAWSHEQ